MLEYSTKSNRSYPFNKKTSVAPSRPPINKTSGKRRTPQEGWGTASQSGSGDENEFENLTEEDLRGLAAERAIDDYDAKPIEQSLKGEAIEFLEDVEVDPLTKEAIATPIADALGYNHPRFVAEIGPATVGIGFKNKDGEIVQVKVFSGKIQDGKRTGNYFCLKGIGDVPYLPPVLYKTAYHAAAKAGPLCEASFLERFPKPCGSNGDIVDGSFWDWLQDWKEIPIAITEGCYKALAAISAGVLTISLWGVSCGRKDNRTDPMKIKDSLFPYVQGRTVLLAMDSEQNPITRKNISKLGVALTNHAKSKVYVVEWDGKIGKGIDDLCGVDPELFRQAVKSATPFMEWQLYYHFSLDGIVDIELNTPDLTKEIKSIPDAKLVCIQSTMKTYKTELLFLLIQAHVSNGGKVIVPVHRQQLAKDLAKRLGLEYRTAMTKYGSVFGYCLCIDSLHPKANPGFNPEEWRGAWLLLDEVDQVLWHMLHSNTCQHNRSAILESFRQLVNVVDKIIMTSADLNKVCIDYVEGLIDEPVTRCVIRNNWRHPLRPCYVCDKPQELMDELLRCLALGERVMIHTAGQKDKSTWGTIRIEAKIKKLFPEMNVLRIDGVTTNQTGHPAEGCMEDINAAIEGYDVLVCSPTVETGVSINGDSIDKVFCFAQGSQTVDAVGQALERVRSDVPRYLWCKERVAHSKIASGSHGPYVLEYQGKGCKKIIDHLNRADNQDFLATGKTPGHLITWAKLAAMHNIGFKTYRPSIYRKLENNGFSLLPLVPTQSPPVSDAELDPEYLSNLSDRERMLLDIKLRGAEALKDQMKAEAKEDHAKYCEKVSEAPLLDDAVYQKMRKQRSKTEAERLSVIATEIAKKYLAEDVTPELVDNDSKDGWHDKLKLHYYLMRPDSMVVERDQSRIKSLEGDGGEVFTPDLVRSCLSHKVATLKHLGLDTFLTPGRVFSNQDEDLQAFLSKARDGSPSIWSILTVFVGTDPEAKGNGPIDVLKRFLRLLGLTTECVGTVYNSGERVKQFAIKDLDPDGRNAIFSRWDEVTPPPTPTT